MANNTQSRINITLDLHEEGAARTKELPLKLLVLAHLSGVSSTLPVKQRVRSLVTKTTLNEVMSQLNPRLSLSVASTTEPQKHLSLDLSFHAVEEFNPEYLVHQVPALKQLLAKRYLLNDLKSQLIDNPTLVQAIKTLLNDPKKVQRLQARVSDL